MTRFSPVTPKAHVTAQSGAGQLDYNVRISPRDPGGHCVDHKWSCGLVAKNSVSWAASDRIFNLEEAQRDFTSVF